MSHSFLGQKFVRFSERNQKEKNGRSFFSFLQYMILIVALCFLSISSDSHEESTVVQAHLKLFNEICSIIEKNFYNKVFIQEQFPKIEAEYKNKIQTIATESEFSITVNSMLKQLHSAHTNYLSPHDYEYYHLASIFAFCPSIQALFPQEIVYPTVGIITEIIEGHVFISSVLSGSLAEKVGLLMGDEILGVNGSSYQVIDSLKDHIGKKSPL